MRKKKVTDLLKDTVQRISPHLVSPASQQEETQEPPPKKRKEVKAFFSFMPESGPTTSSDNLSSTAEVDEYVDLATLPMDANPATFWKENKKKFPLLSILAKEVLSIPSSSAPVERLFSIAGKVFTPERCRLTDKRFEQLMFIRCNNDLDN